MKAEVQLVWFVSDRSPLLAEPSWTIVSPRVIVEQLVASFAAGSVL